MDSYNNQDGNGGSEKQLEKVSFLPIERKDYWKFNVFIEMYLSRHIQHTWIHIPN